MHNEMQNQVNVATKSSSSLDLPLEIITKPLPLIGINGLDTTNNPIHNSIWLALNSNGDHRALNYKLINNGDELPPAKAPRTNYDNYIPNGILKTNWLKKHLQEVPAIIAVFYQLEWLDTNWNERIIECSSRVQSMRALVQPRACKIVLVLLQQEHAPPLSEGSINERHDALCVRCELPRKNLFVLPHGNYMDGYISRLEANFHEIANVYYQQKIKTIKTHRDYLNKSIHLSLYVRHQFKMGFFSEVRQDKHLCYKHYTHAYENLKEYNINEYNHHEIRTVAACINYKLCKLMFALEKPRDAINHLSTHVYHFGKLSQFKTQRLAFQHYAWLSKQYQIFGDIFDEAVRFGLPAVQIQHPGFYYQQAAEYAVLRKKACLQFSNVSETYPTPDPLFSDSLPQYYGQKLWQTRHASMTEEIENALLWLERNSVNHSNIIISLYGLAINQFKVYRCPRMRVYLINEMAVEYISSGEFVQALTILTHVLYNYRKEKWFEILSHIFKNALYCAQITANVKDFLGLCLEILSDSVLLPIDYKSQVLQAIYDVLDKKTPKIHDLSETNPTYHQLWQSNGVERILVNMKEVCLPMQVKFKFTSSSIAVDQHVHVELFVKCRCSHPIKISSITIVLGTSHSQKELVIVPGMTINQWTNPNFEFSDAGVVKRYLARFKPEINDVNETYSVISIQLKLGYVDRCQLTLQYSGLGNEPFTKFTPYTEYQSHVTYSSFTPLISNIDFDMIMPVTVAHVTSREALVHVQMLSDTVGLVGEWFHVLLLLKNRELTKLLRVVVSVDVACVDDQLVEISSDAVNSFQSRTITFTLPSLDVDITSKINFYVRTSGPTRVNFSIKTSYGVDAKTIEKSTPKSLPKPVQLEETASVQPEKLDDTCLLQRAFFPEPIKCTDKCLDMLTWRRLNEKESEIGFYKMEMLLRMKIQSLDGQCNMGRLVDDFYGQLNLDERIHVNLNVSDESNVKFIDAISEYVEKINADASNLVQISGEFPNNSLKSIDKSFAVNDAVEFQLLNAREETENIPRQLYESYGTSQLDATFVQPFQFKCEFLSRRMCKLSTLYVNEEFLVVLSVINCSPIELEMVEFNVEMNPLVTLTTNDERNRVEIQPFCAHVETNLAVIKRLSLNAYSETVRAGKLTIKWKRKTTSTHVYTSEFDMGETRVELNAITLTMSLPQQGVALTPMDVTYSIRNNTTLILTLKIDIYQPAEDTFVFSGYKQKQICVLPDSTYQMEYVFYPLTSGMALIPRLQIQLVDQAKSSEFNQQHINDIVNRAIQTSVFVLPQSRSGACQTTIPKWSKTIIPLELSASMVKLHSNVSCQRLPAVVSLSGTQTNLIDSSPHCNHLVIEATQ